MPKSVTNTAKFAWNWVVWPILYPGAVALVLTYALVLLVTPPEVLVVLAFLVAWMAFLLIAILLTGRRGASGKQAAKRASEAGEAARKIGVRSTGKRFRMFGGFIRGFDTGASVEGDDSSLHGTDMTAPRDAPLAVTQADGLQLRISSPPDPTDVAHVEWPHLAVTNNSSKPVRIVKALAVWNKNTQTAQFRWNGEQRHEVVVSANGRKSEVTPLCVYGRVAWSYGSNLHSRGRLNIPASTCVLCDENFHMSNQIGSTLPQGRTSLRIDLECEDGSVFSTHFEVWVPLHADKSLWVVPTGRMGSD